MTALRTSAETGHHVDADEVHGRLLIVSNRLPMTASVAGSRLQVHPSPGGLATGLRQLASRYSTLWFGWSGIAASSSDEPRGGQLAPHTVSVPLEDHEITGFYHHYSNGVLWPALHGWTDEPPPSTADWLAYRAVNERFARTVAEHCASGDRVWVHDYHLLLMPQLLRRLAPGVPIAFFLHTPCPAPDVFRTIPHARELIDGLLGSDVIGFHTLGYAQNFLRLAASFGYRVRGSEILADGRTIRVKVGPMGIDFDSFAQLAEDPRVHAELSRLRRTDSALLLGVDRLDYIKGIPQRLLAFEKLLETHPELHGRVSLLQIAVPSREELGAYRDLREVVESIVRRINGNFGTVNWSPVDYLYGTVDLTTLVALYRACHVMLVTSLCDGLNLVAKEFVAARVDHDGVLVLSKFAGAAAELKAALQVNPQRVDDLCAAYYTALTMRPAERTLRMRALRRAVGANNLFHWATHFLGPLTATEPVVAT